MIISLLYNLIRDLTLIVPLLIAVAYFTLLERKVMAAMQRRRGPNMVGVVGLLQPFADGLKLFIKELVVPSRSNKLLFFFAPIISLMVSFAAWLVIPLQERAVLSDFDMGILWVLMCSSLGVYGIILSGWSSNSKFAFLGCLRSCAQMVSYEVSLSIILLQVIVLSQSTNLSEIVSTQNKVWFVIPLFPFAIMWIISAIAETNRPPFDLPEAEAELVAGYSVEYGSMGFAYFFIAEYANIILMGALTVILFLGGWLAPLPLKVMYILPPSVWFATKLLFCLFLFVWVRAAFPRYRFDQLMHITWRLFLPLSLCGLILVMGVVYGFTTN